MGAIDVVSGEQTAVIVMLAVLVGAACCFAPTLYAYCRYVHLWRARKRALRARIRTHAVTLSSECSCEEAKGDVEFVLTGASLSLGVDPQTLRMDDRLTVELALGDDCLARRFGDFEAFRDHWLAVCERYGRAIGDAPQSIGEFVVAVADIHRHCANGCVAKASRGKCST